MILLLWASAAGVTFWGLSEALYQAYQWVENYRNLRQYGWLLDLPRKRWESNGGYLSRLNEKALGINKWPVASPEGVQ